MPPLFIANKGDFCAGLLYSLINEMNDCFAIESPIISLTFNVSLYRRTFGFPNAFMNLSNELIWSKSGCETTRQSICDSSYCSFTYSAGQKPVSPLCPASI